MVLSPVLSESEIHSFQHQFSKHSDLSDLDFKNQWRIID